MCNFAFLQQKEEYALFSGACVDAENLYATGPAPCAQGCRRALGFVVQWIYAADSTLTMPRRAHLQTLLHETDFRETVDPPVWGKLPYIGKLGNLADEKPKTVTAADALLALESLFSLVQWLDYHYGDCYTRRTFDPARIPTQPGPAHSDEGAEREREKIEAQSARFTERKHRKKPPFFQEDLTEFQTRKIYIDVDLREKGWTFSGPDADVAEEYPVTGMAGVPNGLGFADYVLFGRDGLPLAVVEAKRTSVDPNVGRTQCGLYADCLEARFGRRPMRFTTNGFETFFWDDCMGPQRPVSGVFSKEDLQRLMQHREERLPLGKIPIDDRITDRYYQKAAIHAVCERVEQGFRKHLLVMATGTGKTRTASSLTDVLSRGKYVTNILFLADRTALVRQAKDDFKKYLPDLSLCNLCTNKDDRQARIIFSTYPTILNAIDDTKSDHGRKLFTPAHFDLIIIDESHRSIFKKYRAIFDYFDAILLGLTATPKNDVDRNTYEFFEMQNNVPTYAYDYETAVYTDHVLVPYYNYEVRTKFLEDGITYEDLSDEDKERYEEDFAEDDLMPDFIPSAALNEFVFNEQTVDLVLQDLMERGIHINGGDCLGKTIIFAQNKHHAEFILNRFNALYPQYHGNFAKRVICDDTYAQTVIDDFKDPEKEPHIAVSVDMMDTGIDVPEAVNLVFFKKVRSRTKFWQMIGRGTRLCKGLECVDAIDGEYTDKRRFLIFDYCGNFEYFREHREGYESKETKSLSENIFGKQIRIAMALQDDPDTADFRNALVDTCQAQVRALNMDRISVRLHRKTVEKFQKPQAFAALSETDKGELLREIAPLVYLDEKDECAKRFDNFMYGLMLCDLEQLPGLRNGRKQLTNTALLLEKKASIPQVQEKLSLLREIQTPEFWEHPDPLRLESVRQDLRELIQFLDKTDARREIYTRLSDPIVDTQEGKPLDMAEDLEDYRAKVNRYILEHENTLAIYKLSHNIPLTQMDYTELEQVFTCELGSREDYSREFGDTPFGLLVRKVAKLDHQAAMEAFSAFINDESLNSRQIAFVNKVILHIEHNGYMENITELTKPPFDKPVSFLKLFDNRRRTQLMETLNQVRDNAVKIAVS